MLAPLGSITASSRGGAATVSLVALRRATLMAVLLLFVSVVACTATPMPDPRPSTTTTTVPTPTAAPAPPRPPATSAPSPHREDGTGPGVIGYVGCSVTRDAVEGYAQVGGERLWPFEGVSYGGASVGRWAAAVVSGSGHWRDFETLLATNPHTQGLWVQLCTAGTPTDDLASAVSLLDELRQRVPDVDVWVSAQPDYVDHECGIAGPAGPARMQSLVDDLVQAGHAQRGPVVGPLREDQTLDGCHANEDGQGLMGEQLVAFFGDVGTDGARAEAAEQTRRRPGRPRPPGDSPP